MEQNTYSRAVLQQRLTALFNGGTWQYLETNSDLRLAEGEIAGRKVMVIATDPAAALGTFGVDECIDFKWAVLRARATGHPIVLLIDSAGTRLTAGLPVQGAIRALMREVLNARLAEVPMLAAVGRYAFGSGSMLSFSADARVYAAQTQLAMSGPRVLQTALPEGTSRDVVTQTINGVARAAAGNAETLIDDDLDAYANAVSTWVARPVTAGVTQATLHVQRQHLSQRLADNAQHVPANTEGPVLCGDTVQCVMDRAFGAADAILLADLMESACAQAPKRSMTLVMDCPGHSILLADEAVILSEYLAHLALSLRYLVHHGASIRLRITGTLSGGIYICLAAATSSTELVSGATIRTLPASSLVSIFGSEMTETTSSHFYIEWGLVDRIALADDASARRSEAIGVPGKAHASAWVQH